MPVISKMGSRNLRIRLVYSAMYLVLVLGAVTMIYPFMLMLAGSVGSEVDVHNMTPFPGFWCNDEMLFKKYIEFKYNMSAGLLEESWADRVISLHKVEPPQHESPYLEDFLEWRGQCLWWWLGHSGGQMQPYNTLGFRHFVKKRYGDLNRLKEKTAFPLRTWDSLQPPPPNRLRYPRERKGLLKDFLEFAEDRPVHERIIMNLDGMFLSRYLIPKYTYDINAYNREHGTEYNSYREIFLTPRVPKNQKQREDWEVFVRTTLPLWYIRLDLELTGNYQRFLAEKKYESIEKYNGELHSAYESFDQIPMPTSIPEDRISQLVWSEFIKAPQYCLAEHIQVYGSRQIFEEYVASKRGIPAEQLSPVRLPIAEADLYDCFSRKGELRWQFTIHNYRVVCDYLLRYGRGFVNTVIYCGLAVGAALLVNPLAAYALSRYKPPSAYTILLFCMATMAFPGEVTMIPAFLLLKRFPLWSLLGAGAAFILALWTIGKIWRNSPEWLRMLFALCAGVFVGTWFVPAVVGAPNVSLLNTFAALVMPGMANGLSIFLLKGFFDSLPRELYEAADLDGASEWSKFWSFTMGLSKPILAVIALGAFTGAYSQFMFALVIIPNQKMWTIMVWLFQFQNDAHQAIRYASLVIAAIPTFLVFIFCQRIIIRGIVVPTEK